MILFLKSNLFNKPFILIKFLYEQRQNFYSTGHRYSVVRDGTYKMSFEEHDKRIDELFGAPVVTKLLLNNNLSSIYSCVVVKYFYFIEKLYFKGKKGS